VLWTLLGVNPQFGSIVGEAPCGEGGTFAFVGVEVCDLV